MSEANRDQPPTFIEGELSLDDLSQIAGGTGLTASSFDLSDPAGVMLKPSDNMFNSHVGAAGSQPEVGYKPMNMTLSFP